MHRRILALLLVVATSGTASADESFAPRRPFHDIGRGLSTVAHDAGAYALAPFRASKRDLLVAGGVLAVGGLLYAFDDDIHRLVQRNEGEFFFDETRRVGDRFHRWGLMGPTTRYYAGLMVVGYGIDQPWLVRMGAEVLESQFLCGYVRQITIRAFGRSRPHEARGAYDFEPGEGTSFPSGHATSIWSAAEILRQHADRWWVTTALYTIAGCVSLQRLYAEQHWASDVWTGAALGIATARFIHARHEGADPDGTRLRPRVGPDGSPGLGLTWGF